MHHAIYRDLAIFPEDVGWAQGGLAWLILWPGHGREAGPHSGRAFLSADMRRRPVKASQKGLPPAVP